MKQRTLVLGVRLGVIAMSGLYGHLVVKKLNNEREINRRFVHKTAEQIRKVKEESSEENAQLAYTYVLGLREKIFRLVDKVEKDYIKIEYSGGDNLYILATQLDMIQKL